MTIKCQEHYDITAGRTNPFPKSWNHYTAEACTSEYRIQQSPFLIGKGLCITFVTCLLKACGPTYNHPAD